MKVERCPLNPERFDVYDTNDDSLGLDELVYCGNMEDDIV